MVKLLYQQQVTLGREKYVAFTILPCCTNCAFGVCLLEIILFFSVGEGEELWHPEQLLIAFCYEIGFNDVLGRRSGNDLQRFAVKEEDLYLFWERNYPCLGVRF